MLKFRASSPLHRCFFSLKHFSHSSVLPRVREICDLLISCDCTAALRKVNKKTLRGLWTADPGSVPGDGP